MTLSPPMSHCAPNLSDQALEFLCDIRFHRLFTYISNNASYRVSYSDYGSPSSTVVVLFFGGLLGGRLSYSPLDTLARRYNIRIIHADRPGIGATTPVRIEDRISDYVDTVARLLQNLGVKHVSLAAHSFGTVYAMNFLLLHPHLLHHERPYAAFWAPWVSPGHSGVRHLQAAGMVPAGVIDKFSGLARVVNSNVIPVLGMSSGLSSMMARSLKSSTPTRDVADQRLPELNAGIQRPEESDVNVLNLDDSAVVKELRTLLPTFLFAENVDGAGQDAQLCLRKPRSVPWSTPDHPWKDIDDAVRQLRGVVENSSHPGRRLRIDAFHAESDGMVGVKGQAWFDSCWQSDIGGSVEEERILYRSEVVKSSDHDFILDPFFGASERWLERVAESSRGDVDAAVAETSACAS